VARDVLFEWRHDTDERRWVAPLLEWMLKSIAAAMESGTLKYVPAGGLRRVEWT
jgi:hypothetical protein